MLDFRRLSTQFHGLFKPTGFIGQQITSPEVWAKKSGDQAAGQAVFRQLAAELETGLVDLEEVIERVLLGFFAGGHVLLQGFVGLAKSLLVTRLARVLALNTARIQFTPDLLPQELITTAYYDKRENSYQFRNGPVFCNVLHADEINRASPKTQSALLEAMAEGSVTTVSEGTKLLPKPFFVVATQNPNQMEGTYPLPEAQLDRFLLMETIPFPAQRLHEVLLTTTVERSKARVKSLRSKPQRSQGEPAKLEELWRTLRSVVGCVEVPKTVAEEVATIVLRTWPWPNTGGDADERDLEIKNRTRDWLAPMKRGAVDRKPLKQLKPRDDERAFTQARTKRSKPPKGSENIDKFIDTGAGVRAGQSIVRLAQARALLVGGRARVTREDVLDVALCALRHRVVPNANLRLEGRRLDDILEEVIPT